MTVYAGQPVRASDINSANRTAERATLRCVRGGGMSVGPGGVSVSAADPFKAPPSQLCVRAHNAGSAGLDKFAAAVILGFYHDDASGVPVGLVLSVSAADSETTGNAAVVTMDAIPAGSVGYVAIQGLAVARVSGTFEDMGNCGVTEDGAYFEIGSGSVSCIWAEEGTEERYGIVMLGGGGLTIRSVADLPPIPASGMDVVFWTGGTPPQVWWTDSGASVWYPGYRWTADSGTPET